MKLLTKNLTYFALFFVIGTLIFRYSLSFFLEDRAFTLVWISAAIYFIYNFIIGWIFGKRDYVLLPLFDIGFRFHLVSYVFLTAYHWPGFYLNLMLQLKKLRPFILLLQFGGESFWPFILYFIYTLKDKLLRHKQR